MNKMESKMPKVSVIISAFNHEKYIADSINSVLNQTYKNFEIIVINDGSTDNTSIIIGEIANENKDKITFIDHKVNQRPKLSGNEGISLAKGQFIAFNDGDDIWYPTKLEKQMQMFEHDILQKIGLVYCYGKNINENSSRFRSEIEAVDVKEDVFSQLFESAFFFKISMVVRKEVIKAVGLMDERYPYCCDYGLMIRIAAEGFQFDRVPEVLVGHRIHDANETADIVTAQLNTKDMLQDIAIRYNDLIISKNINIQQRLSVCDLRIARHYFAKGENKLCREYILKILKLSPSLFFSDRLLFPITFLSLMPKSIRNIFKHVKPFNKLFLAT